MQKKRSSKTKTVKAKTGKAKTGKAKTGKAKTAKAAGKKKEAALIKAGKSIDASSFAILKKDFDRQSGKAGEKLTVDLKAAKSIDPFGIAALLALRNSFIKAGGQELELINISGDIALLFDSLRLDRHFIVAGR